MTAPTDRLTEIKARVAEEAYYIRENVGVQSWWLSDLEYALGEIERLHDISAFNGLTEQVKALSAERDRLRTALLSSACPKPIVGDTVEDCIKSGYCRCDNRAALEESK